MRLNCLVLLLFGLLLTFHDFSFVQMSCVTEEQLEEKTRKTSVISMVALQVFCFFFLFFLLHIS